jgi:hypothetical protein
MNFKKYSFLFMLGVVFCVNGPAQAFNDQVQEPVTEIPLLNKGRYMSMAQLFTVKRSVALVGSSEIYGGPKLMSFTGKSSFQAVDMPEGHVLSNEARQFLQQNIVPGWEKTRQRILDADESHRAAVE